jgi:DNA-binding response OmpR family regulator
MADTLLLVEDDPSILRGLQMNLSLEGFLIVAARNGEEGLRLLRAHRPALVVLDLMLPGMDGLAVIRTVRAEDTETPILVLSAKDQEADKVMALSLGADDYVSKPFGLAELLARIRAALRRRRRHGERKTTFGNVTIDVEGRRLFVGDKEVESTAKEFDLLRFFHAHPGIVFTREQLMQQVWGPDHFGSSRTIDNFVAKLRQKIEQDPDSPRYLETVRGIGYRFNA